jgi:hypothetical protein
LAFEIEPAAILAEVPLEIILSESSSAAIPALFCYSPRQSKEQLIMAGRW